MIPSTRPLVLAAPCLLAALSVSLLATAAQAQSTWVGTGADGNWSTSANWDGENLPSQSGGRLVFAGTTNLATSNDNDFVTQVTGSSAAAHAITFSSGAGAFTLAGSNLGFSGVHLIKNESTSNQTIGNSFSIAGGDNRISFVNGAGSITLNGSVGFGGGRLYLDSTNSSVSSPSKIVLNGANTGAGVTFNAWGITEFRTVVYAKSTFPNTILELGHKDALGSDNTTLGLQTGIQLESELTIQSNANLTGANAVDKSLLVQNGKVLTLSGSSNLEFKGSFYNANGNATVLVNNTAATTLSGTVYLSHNTTGRTLNVNVAGGSGSTTISGVIVDSWASGAGSSGITKQGAGSLSLTAANTYTGNTTISNDGGNLTLAHPFLSDKSSVSIGTNSTLNLTHGQTDKVSVLFLGGVRQNPGVYGPVGSAAPNTTPFITGTGFIEVAPATWDGGGADNNWATAANWLTNTVPTAGTTTELYFDGSVRTSPSNNLAAGSDFAQINFAPGAAAFTLTGNAVRLNAGVIVKNESANDQVVALPVTVPANTDHTIDAGGHKLSFNGGVDFTNAQIVPGGTAGTIAFNAAGTGSGRNSSGNLYALTNANNTALNRVMRNDLANPLLELGHAQGLGAGVVQTNASTRLQTSIALTGANAVGNTFVLGNSSLTITGSNNIEMNGSAQNFKDSVGGDTGINAGAIISAGNDNQDRVLFIDNTGTTTISGKVYLNDGIYGNRELTVDVSGAAGTAVISGPIIGHVTGGVSGHFVKAGAGNLTLSGANTYAGNTTVNGTGTLTITTPYLADTSTVNVSNTAKLNLTHTGTDVVAAFQINGVSQGSGTYDSGNTSVITGSGKIQVPATGGYSSWATTNAGGQGAGLDFDGDGMPNGAEYFMNAATGFTANPPVVSGKVAWTNGGNIPSSAYGTEFSVQTSSNLSVWDDVLVTDPKLSNTAGSVEYTLPTGAGKLFVRLKVTPN